MEPRRRGRKSRVPGPSRHLARARAEARRLEEAIELRDDLPASQLTWTKNLLRRLEEAIAEAADAGIHDDPRDKRRARKRQPQELF